MPQSEPSITALNLQDPAHQAAIRDLWNAAMPAGLHIDPRMVEFNTRPTDGALQAGWMTASANAFVLASAWPRANAGWIDAIAVRPAAQRTGLGAALLTKAEAWVRAQGAVTIRLGGSLRPFAAGLPVPEAAPFFINRGYASAPMVWDVALDLSSYHPHKPHIGLARVRPAGQADVPAMREFFARAFPGRWQFEFEEFLREGGDPSDYMILIDPGSDGGPRVEAFCQTTTERSLRPLGRFFMNGLTEPWGQAGPIGVSAERRGRGYAAAVMHAAFAALQANGVRGCLIDWTTLLDFYAKFGFSPHRGYHMLTKSTSENSSAKNHES